MKIEWGSSGRPFCLVFREKMSLLDTPLVRRHCTSLTSGELRHLLPSRKRGQLLGLNIEDLSVKVFQDTPCGDPFRDLRTFPKYLNPFIYPPQVF